MPWPAIYKPADSAQAVIIINCENKRITLLAYLYFHMATANGNTMVITDILANKICILSAVKTNVNCLIGY